VKPEGLLVSTGLAKGLVAAAAAVAVMIIPAGALAGSAAPAGPASQAAAQASYIPAQFIAKLYTEGLGRMPDQGGWQGAGSYFAQHGCSAASLAAYGEAVFTSAEYTGLGYDNDAKLLTLYRGALNREPDVSGFSNWAQQLGSGVSWPTAVKLFFTSSEFTALVPRICSGVVDGSGASYYFGTQPALAVPTAGSGFTGSEAGLQSLLNDAAASDGTVALAQRALVSLTSPLIIPAGVTLTTAGAPDLHHYADMGRLVRAVTFPAPAAQEGMVQVQQGAGLADVWVDGARDTPGNTAPLDDVMTYGGGAAVSSDRISNTQGPSSLYLLGGFDGHPCPSEAVSGNLITAYSSDHYLTSDWTDGISDNCEGAMISDNQVVDATDVGIVVYRNTPASAQHSVVTGNYLLSAGNSMYGGMGFDPLYNPAGAAQTLSFAGSAIEGNQLWTGPDTHFDIALTDGSRAWYARAGANPADTGTGASITGNSTGTLAARVQTGVAVNGMINTTVTGNSLTFTHITSGTCPKQNYAAEISAGYASGTFSPAPANIGFDGCI
jgi:hypothetical protein